MSASKCFLYTLCEVIIFLGVSGLIIPPSSFGKNSPPPEQQEENDSPGQGDKRRADPCDHHMNKQIEETRSTGGHDSPE